MTKKLQTWTWWIRYDNLTHIPRQWRHSEPRNGEKKTYNHTPWQTLYTLHWLKSVILPLINTNIWQKLINRSFAMLIYQAERLSDHHQFSDPSFICRYSQHITACKRMHIPGFLNFSWPGHLEVMFSMTYDSNFSCQGLRRWK